MKIKETLKNIISLIKIPFLIIVGLIIITSVGNLYIQLEETAVEDDWCIKDQICFCRDSCRDITGLEGSEYWYYDKHWGNHDCTCITENGSIILW